MMLFHRTKQLRICLLDTEDVDELLCYKPYVYADFIRLVQSIIGCIDALHSQSEASAAPLVRLSWCNYQPLLAEHWNLVSHHDRIYVSICASQTAPSVNIVAYCEPSDQEESMVDDASAAKIAKRCRWIQPDHTTSDASLCCKRLRVYY